MGKALRWFPSDGNETLTDTDALLAASTEEYFRRLRGSDSQILELMILEVGVWKGAWSQTVLMNAPHSIVIGIDPYPKPNTEVKDYMFWSMNRLGVASRFHLFSSWSEVDPSGRFDVVHIDGDHNEKSALADLRFAENLLIDDGMIIVDDFRHRWFPGIASALFGFLHETNFLLLADTGNKAYLVKEHVFTIARQALAATLESTHLSLFAGHTDAYRDLYLGGEFTQSADVLGHPVHIVEPNQSLGRLRNTMRDWIPPKIWRGLRRIRGVRRLRR